MAEFSLLEPWRSVTYITPASRHGLVESPFRIRMKNTSDVADSLFLFFWPGSDLDYWHMAN
jgi:hypothetical protein